MDVSCMRRRGGSMRYRVEFESEEIKRCWDCPMCREWEYDDHDYCRAMELPVKRGKRTPDICPLEKGK